MTKEDYYHLSFEESFVGQAILNEEGQIEHCNSAFLQMVDLDSSSVANRLFSSFLDPADMESFTINLRELMNGTKYQMTMLSRSRFEKRGVRWWRTSFSRHEEGGQNFFHIAIIDVSEDINEKEVLNKQRDLAVQATRSKSAFLANMSHEIRTPIHTVTGMAGLLLETELDQEQREYINQIMFSANSLLGLINDILDFSKIEAGKLEIEQLEFDLIDTIYAACDMLAIEVYKKNIEFLIEFKKEIPQRVVGDPSRIRQIIVNLISNAVKFTHEGHVKIHCSWNSNDGSLLLEVRDTGIGIPQEQQDRLFKAFSQADTSTTRKYGGTGLGLSISKNLVQLMNGNIGFKSKEKLGTTFWFKLPLEHQGSIENPVPSIEVDHHKHILLIENNKGSAQLIGKVLNSQNFTCDIVSQGYQGLDEIRKAIYKDTPYDLVIVDLRLDDMDGWQFASEINSDKSINEIKMILMTPPGAMGADAKMKLLNWYDGYITKPIHWDRFSELVDTVLNKSMDLLAAEDAEELTELAPLSEEDQSIPDFSERNLRVLLVEDHFVNQQLFKTILKKMYISAEVASNGQEAVDIVDSQENFDIIFMDIQMPVMSGYDATRKIRGMGVKTPIVAVTANVLKGEKEKCIQLGMNDFLTKPFQKYDIEAMLLKWFPDTPVHSAEDMSSGVTGSEKSRSVGNIRVFDYDKALLAFMGNVDILIPVLKQYREKTPHTIQDIRYNIDHEKWRDAQIGAHSIKGSSWNLAAAQLGDAGKALEFAVKEKNRRASYDALSSLEKEWNLFAEAVDSKLEEHPEL